MGPFCLHNSRAGEVLDDVLRVSSGAATRGLDYRVWGPWTRFVASVGHPLQGLARIGRDGFRGPLVPRSNVVCNLDFYRRLLAHPRRPQYIDNPIPDGPPLWDVSESVLDDESGSDSDDEPPPLWCPTDSDSEEEEAPWGSVPPFIQPRNRPFGCAPLPSVTRRQLRPGPWSCAPWTSSGCNEAADLFSRECGTVTRIKVLAAEPQMHPVLHRGPPPPPPGGGVASCGVGGRPREFPLLTSVPCRARAVTVNCSACAA